ncbi:MAG: lysoplasmalogenase [Clostridia bacterium]|nr:lysoplasmalogenase [Clostridia bacterium]
MLKVLYFLVVALEFVTVPIFLKYYWPKKCKMSFLFKMISATLFVLSGYLAMKVSGNSTPYATYMLWGLVFGWLGDAFLHVLSEKMFYFVLGVIAFLTGHVFYIIAFQQAIKTTYPDAAAFEWYEIVTVVAVCALILGLVFGLKLISKEKTPLVLGLCVYAVVILAMLLKAFRFIIGEFAYGMNDNMAMISITVGLGAILFVLSDGSLGAILALNKKARSWRIFNIITYFAAQILLAASIFFVRSFEIFGR